MTSNNTKKNNEKFIEKAKDKFGDKFDYSKFIYTNAKTKGIILCPIHGEFLKTPEKHIEKNSNGCNKCYYDKNRNSKREKFDSPPRVTKEDFLERAYLKFFDKFTYDISKYDGVLVPILITCPEHGEFEMTPNAHLLSKGGCNKCSGKIRSYSITRTYEDSIEVVNKIHNNKYTYPIENKEIYINKKSKIKIICSEHGEFIKSVQKHQSGQGCFSCKVNEMVTNKVLVGGYSHILFESDPSLKDKNAILYYLSINDGEYYKVGITTINPKNRGNSIKSKSKGYIKNFDIIYTEEMSLYDAFLKEESILNEYSNKRVFTKWTTELFSEDVLNKDKHEYIWEKSISILGL